MLNAGTYAETIDNAIPSGVTLKAAPGAVVVIQPPASALRALFISGRSNISVEGIVFDALNVVGDGAKIDSGAANVALKNCEVKNAHGDGSTPAQGILVTGGTTTGILIDGCTVHDCGNPGETGTFEHGVYVHPKDVIVRNCEVFNISGHAVHAFSGGISDTYAVENNYLHDCRIGIGMYYGHGLAQNNVIRNMVDEAVRVLYSSVDATVRFNTGENCRIGAGLGSFDQDGAAVALKNNAFNATLEGVDYTPGSAVGVVITSDHNLLDAPTPATWNGFTPTGTDTIGAFSPVTNDGAAAIKPAAGNPAKAGGVAVAGVTTDYGGNVRANPPSIGAWE